MREAVHLHVGVRAAELWNFGTVGLLVGCLRTISLPIEGHARVRGLWRMRRLEFVRLDRPVVLVLVIGLAVTRRRNLGLALLAVDSAKAELLAREDVPQTGSRFTHARQVALLLTQALR